MLCSINTCYYYCSCISPLSFTIITRTGWIKPCIWTKTFFFFSHLIGFVKNEYYIFSLQAKIKTRLMVIYNKSIDPFWISKVWYDLKKLKLWKLCLILVQFSTFCWKIYCVHALWMFNPSPLFSFVYGLRLFEDRKLLAKLEFLTWNAIWHHTSKYLA